MFRSGIARRRRHAALAEMLTSAERAGSFIAPWEQFDEIWQHYHSEAEILAELQQRWRHELAGAVYIAIESGKGDLHSDVAKAYQQIEERYRGMRAVLEAHSDHPAIAAAMRKERSLLEAAMGTADHAHAA